MPLPAVAGYQPFDFKSFAGGLNLRDKADVIGDQEAIDLLNVTFGERGAIRQRDGFLDLSAADLTARVDSMARYTSVAGALRQLVLGCATNLVVIDQIGAVRKTQAGLQPGPWNFARFGDPTREMLFCANGLDPMVSWDGVNFALGTTAATVNGVAGQAMPKAGAVCVNAQQAGTSSGTNASNRLIATAFGSQANAGPGGTASTPSRVFFSNPGQPFIWETDGNASPIRGRNFIDLTPGDGEEITAAVAWRELVFIFKQTKFFILWGEDVGSDSNPVFQVREVVNAIGLATPQAIAVGRDGVYFMNRRGVYLTNGGDPRLLSDVISPFWLQDPDSYFESLPINLARLDLCRALWHMERFYLAVPTGGATQNDRLLVYDTQHNWWSLHDIPASALASFRSGDRDEVHFGYASPLPPRVGHQVLATTSDRGVKITSRWRSGWGDYNNSQVKTIRENKVWGFGAAYVGFSVDFNNVQRALLDTVFGGTGAWPVTNVATWGTWLATYNNKWPGAGQVSDEMVRYAVRGTVFSTRFSSSPSWPTWAVHRITRHMREVREPSIP